MGRVWPFLAALVAYCVLCVTASLALADSRADKLNQNTLGLLAADSQWLSQAIAIATVVQHDQDFASFPSRVPARCRAFPISPSCIRSMPR